MSIQMLREAAQCSSEDFETYRRILMAESAMNEAFGNITKGIKEYCIGSIRTAKSHMNDAKKHAKAGDRKAAKASLAKAVDELKRFRKEVDKMDDDSTLEQVIIMLVMGLAPIITGCAVAIYAGLGIEFMFGAMYIGTQQKMMLDPKHQSEVNKKIKGKDYAEAYGIAFKENKRITRYALLEACDKLIKDCATLEKGL